MMEMKVMKVMMVHLAIILMMEKRVMVTAREAVEEDAVEVDSEEGLDSEDVVSGEDLEVGSAEVLVVEAPSEEALEVIEVIGEDTGDQDQGVEDLEGLGDSEVVMMEERAKPKEVPDLIKNTITLSSVTTLYTYFIFSDKPSQHLILSLGVIVCSTTS